MLSIDFCESDHFYMLSPTARMLYVHFILNADDDGFVDKWRTVLRCSRIERRHYETLKDHGYIIELNEGLIVITDWHRHNTIRADRYIATAYSKELQCLVLDENKRYIKGKCDLLVDSCVPQIREDKNREEKIRKDDISVREEKKSAFTTNDQSFLHTRVASLPGSDTNDDPLFYNGLSNAIRLYFMKKYQSLKSKEFIDLCEECDWVIDGEAITPDNYKTYVDLWMAKK